MESRRTREAATKAELTLATIQLLRMFVPMPWSFHLFCAGAASGPFCTRRSDR
jgi:hypothetical protein